MKSRSLISAGVVLLAVAVAACNQSPHKNNAAKTPEMTSTPVENMRGACLQDIRQFCLGQRGPERRQCLETHKSQLSATCKAFLDSRLQRRLRRRRAF